MIQLPDFQLPAKVPAGSVLHSIEDTLEQSGECAAGSVLHPIEDTLEQSGECAAGTVFPYMDKETKC